MRTREEEKLDESINTLRLTTFENGFPFMIKDPKIAPNGFINEYPDGSMKIMKLADNQQTILEVRKLTTEEINDIRQKYKLSQHHYA